MKFVFINEGFVPEEKASLPIHDLSIQRSFAVFDFFRLTGNQPLFLEDHLDRFYHSANRLRLPVPYQRDGLRHILAQLITKNNLPGTGMKITLTGGSSHDGLTPAKPNLVISQHSFAPPAAAQQKDGIALATYPHQRQLPDVKSTDYLMMIYLQSYLQQTGADDLLYYNDQHVTESPRSNFFLITKDETLVTPEENVLKGITRKNMLRAAREHFKIEERNISLKELAEGKGAFLTSTTKQILPVRRIDDVVYNNFFLIRKLQQLLQHVTGL